MRNSRKLRPRSASFARNLEHNYSARINTASRSFITTASLMRNSGRTRTMKSTVTRKASFA
jgi:hypothetical protein